MKYSDLTLEEKRAMYDKLQEYFAGQGKTIKEVDKIIEQMSLEQKVEAIRQIDSTFGLRFN